MKAAVARKPIKIAVVESDPLRFVGFRALFDTEPEFELISAGLPEISTLQDVDLILLGNRSGQNLFDVMASLKATRPDLRIIVTGSGLDEETILKAIASGAKGLCGRSGLAGGICAGDSHRESGIGVGAAASAFDVH
jgi:DNA-binding NarL/FixJ family response regulator